MSKAFTGAITALITPFKNSEIDFNSLGQLVEHQLANGIQGFVVNGTTAESPTLSQQEVAEIYKAIKNQVLGKVPLILGTGTNSTKSSIENTKAAKELGADGALVVCPYYNKPTQAGMVSHFQAIATAVDIPIVLYNVPGRTIVSLSAESTSILSREKNIVGIKEASGEMQLLKGIQQGVDSDFCLLSGDDGTCYDFFNRGGDGVISVMSHVVPKETVKWVQQAQQGMDKAEAQFQAYVPLIEALFCEPNPSPVKWALQQMGIIETCECRLPLLELSETGQEKLQPLLQQLKLI